MDWLKVFLIYLVLTWLMGKPCDSLKVKMSSEDYQSFASCHQSGESSICKMVNTGQGGILIFTSYESNVSAD